MMKAITFLLLLVISIFTFAQDDLTLANNRALKAGIILGAAFTQVDGDRDAGYSKLGTQSGITAMLPFADNFGVGFEMLYSMKGSRFKFFGDDSLQHTVKLKLNYAEIPVFVQYFDYQGKFTAQAGFSFARSFSASEDFDGEERPVSLVTNVKDWDFSGIASIGYLFHKNFMLDIRFGYSLVAAGNNQDPDNPDNSSAFKNFGIYNNTVAIRIKYLFSPFTKR